MSIVMAPRMHAIAPFHVMELLRRAHELEAEGRDVIHMEVGEPDFPTPAPILLAAQAYLARGQVRYTQTLGIPALREAIARFYQTRFKVEVAPERIAVTAGASGALTLALAALTAPGDEWLLPDPTYPSNRQIVRAFEGSVRTLPVDARSAYQPTAQAVEAAWRPKTRGLMLASPANPTGTLIPPAQLAALHQATRARGGQLIVDEIYQGLTYDTPAGTALSQFDDIIVINSFSKYFGMTGWRLGWMVVPQELAREVEKLAQHVFISPSTPAQHAALAAFTPETIEILEARRTELKARRDYLLPALQALGFRIDSRPEGAFYVYADISALADDADRFAHQLLESALVATTPGIDFGHYRASHHLRLAYTQPLPRLEEAVERLHRFLGDRDGQHTPSS